MGKEFLDVLCHILLHLLENPFRLVLRQITQEVGRFGEGHLFDDVGGVRRIEIFDQAHLDLRVGFFEGLGGRLHIEGTKDGGALMDIEILDDIRQIGRMELSQTVLGDRQSEEIRRGDGLDKFPGDQLIRQGVVKKDPEEEIDRALQSHTPQEAMKAHIHMDQVEDFLRLEKLQVVHPPDLRPVRVHHLLVQEGVFQQQFSRAEHRRSGSLPVGGDGQRACH